MLDMFNIGMIFPQKLFLDSWPLKMGPIICPETSLINYRYSLPNIPEARRWSSTSRRKSIITQSSRSSHRTWVAVEYNWKVMAHGDAREGKWRGNWRMEWVASTLHTTSEHGVSSITTADTHTSAASSRLNWRPCRFKWTRPFRRKTKSGSCACTMTFQTQSNCYSPRRA